MKSLLSISLLGLLALQPTITVAYWRMACSVSQTARVDPILNPGGVASHVHKFAGGNNVNENSDFNSLRQSTCSSCEVQKDTSAYWTPQLYFAHSSGVVEEVPNYGMTVYYVGRGDQSNTKPFPPGFKMISGETTARSYDQTTLTYMNTRPVADRVSFRCINEANDIPETHYLNDTNCVNGLRAQINFQSCWDGSNLYLDDSAHVAYLSNIDSGVCPPSHPVSIPGLFFEVLYFTNDIDQSAGGEFVFSNGDPTGFGFHADFMNGWDMDVLDNAVENCLYTDVDFGVTSACPYLNESDTQNFSRVCPEEPSVLTEAVKGKLDGIPGCNPITPGPQPAPQEVCPVGQVTPVNATTAAQPSNVSSSTTTSPSAVFSSTSSVPGTGVAISSTFSLGTAITPTSTVASPNPTPTTLLPTTLQTSPSVASSSSNILPLSGSTSSISTVLTETSSGVGTPTPSSLMSTQNPISSGTSTGLLTSDGFSGPTTAALEVSSTQSNSQQNGVSTAPSNPSTVGSAADSETTTVTITDFVTVTVTVNGVPIETTSAVTSTMAANGVTATGGMFTVTGSTYTTFFSADTGNTAAVDTPLPSPGLGQGNNGMYTITGSTFTTFTFGQPSGGPQAAGFYSRHSSPGGIGAIDPPTTVTSTPDGVNPGASMLTITGSTFTTFESVTLSSTLDADEETSTTTLFSTTTIFVTVTPTSTTTLETATNSDTATTSPTSSRVMGDTIPNAIANASLPPSSTTPNTIVSSTLPSLNTTLESGIASTSSSGDMVATAFVTVTDPITDETTSTTQTTLTLSTELANTTFFTIRGREVILTKL
ncbi:uncharacterized protein PV06_03601 [Exophiala oligosperma]|uniref:DUF1996 domain-containing protein n=1 Tax=Exophiala oligosperma TaxID=215243 RepID=A0A0D2EB22_9EURO|nr:uncharacterized protein PV06_03601 [Exophiala oligosperma]KIW45199.1 hypothetical protein PV06_03601 [Exophiala oligosperma]